GDHARRVFVAEAAEARGERGQGRLPGPAVHHAGEIAEVVRDDGGGGEDVARGSPAPRGLEGALLPRDLVLDGLRQGGEGAIGAELGGPPERSRADAQPL